jgi:hypothetical protein
MGTEYITGAQTCREVWLFGIFRVFQGMELYRIGLPHQV